jgi:hypothetical protein
MDGRLICPIGTVGLHGPILFIHSFILLILYPDLYQISTSTCILRFVIKEGVVELFVVFLDDLEVVLLFCERRV